MGNVPDFTGTTFHTSSITQTAPPVPTQFPGRLLIMLALTGFSARMHLGHDIPIFQILSSGLASVFSAFNQSYANVS